MDRGEPIKAHARLRRDGLQPFFYVTLNAAPTERRPVISWKLDIRLDDNLTVSRRTATANQVTSRKESQSYRMSGIENFNTLGKPPLFLVELVHETGWGKGDG